MKYIVVVLLAVVASSFSSCKKIDSEPPRTEAVFTKSYKLPDPAPITADQSILLKEIQAEYNEAIKNAK